MNLLSLSPVNNERDTVERECASTRERSGNLFLLFCPLVRSKEIKSVGLRDNENAKADY